MNPLNPLEPLEIQNIHRFEETTLHGALHNFAQGRPGTSESPSLSQLGSSTGIAWRRWQALKVAVSNEQCERIERNEQIVLQVDSEALVSCLEALVHILWKYSLNDCRSPPKSNCSSCLSTSKHGKLGKLTTASSCQDSRLTKGWSRLPTERGSSGRMRL